MQRFVICTLALAALAISPAAAQTLTRITPEVGDPGDVVIISGTGLGGVTTVRFGAEVGGFAGWWIIDVPPLTVTPTMVTAVVPTFGNFIPPSIPNGSSPFGTLECIGPGFSNSLAFFYMEQTQGQFATPGLGTTQGGLAGRPVIGFTIAGGAPVAGNPSFVLTLENATPSATAVLVLGAPAVPPGAPYLDGFVGIDLTQPFVFLQPTFTVNSAGDVLVPIPLPAAPGVTAALVWGIVDPVTFAVGISDALKVTL